MTNTLIIYYTNYMSHSRNLPLDKNRKVRSAIIPIIEVIYSDYKSIVIYNWTSLYLYYLSPRRIMSFESSSSRILGFPLFVRLFYKTCIQKVFNQKNTGLYFKNYIYNMQIIIIFTKRTKIMFGIV